MWTSIRTMNTVYKFVGGQEQPILLKDTFLNYVFININCKY